MRERPIIFSGPMIRAIMEGRKTQTRRVVKPQPISRSRAENRGVDGDLILSIDGGLMKLRTSRGRNAGAAGIMVETPYPCPYGVPGDRLWVKETWRPFWHPELYCSVQYAADSSYRKPEFAEEERGHRFADLCEQSGDNAEKWHPSIHMWREMSRITLEVVSVKVERLQEISEADAMAELGANPNGTYPAEFGYHNRLFTGLWESIHGKGSWKLNPFVWVLSFKKV